MKRSWIPAILRPDFTWPQPMSPIISETTPPVPRVPSKTSQRIWGMVHKLLYFLSERYCDFFQLPFNPHVKDLPFGLVLKWTNRVSIEEAIAMQMTRAAGMPVPRMLSCGYHPGEKYNRHFSILMTRLPGLSLVNSSDDFIPDEEEPWVHELKKCIDAMRLWKDPADGSYIGSVIGTAIHSTRVPGHIMGPFGSEAELHDFLLDPASSHAFKSKAEYEKTLSLARKLGERPHRVTFTHGDLKAHNILVGDDGHLSGFLDWESAGWCPEYWDFTTAMRFGQGSWWYQVASWMGGDRYLPELASDKAVNNLTVDSYISF